ARFVIRPVDRSPSFFQKFRRYTPERNAFVAILIHRLKSEREVREHTSAGARFFHSAVSNEDIVLVRRDKDIFTHVDMEYDRDDHAAFNRTYKQICNSLKIE